MDSRKTLFYALVFLNIFAVLVGLFYYQWQLADTPLPLLLFVPDCPLYVFLALLIIIRAVKSDAFSFIVSCGMVKYGLWTVFVLLFHPGVYFAGSFMLITSILFIFGHLGMALEGFALLPKKRVGGAILLFAIAWFLLNDYADYSLGAVPQIPPEGMETVAALTIAASLAIPLLLGKYSEKAAKLGLVGWLRKIIGSQ